MQYDMMKRRSNHMSFDERYQLLDSIQDNGVKTFIAREIATGKTVTIFLFAEEQARLHAGLLDQLRAADCVQLPELVDFGNNQGTIYAVLEPRIDFEELKDRVARLESSSMPLTEKKTGEFSQAGIWRMPTSMRAALGQKKSSEKAPILDKPSLPADTSTKTGSFLHMFKADTPPIGESKPEAPKTPAASTAKHSTGKFTGMFQAVTPSIGDKNPVSPKVEAVQPASGSLLHIVNAEVPSIGDSKTEAPNAPATPTVRPEPGEFTRMFQAAAPSKGETKPAPPKIAAAQPAPESFEKMFPAAAPPIGDPKIETPKASSAKETPGEFTRFFNAASSTPPAPTPPRKPEVQGEFESIFGRNDHLATPPSTGTGIFNQSRFTPAMKREQAGSAPVPTPPPAFNSPAGEFTRIFGDTSSEIPILASIAAPPTPSAPMPPSDPGEYTRIFGASSIHKEPIGPPSSVPTPIEAPKPSAPAKRSSLFIPVLIGAILLLLAAIAIIWFVMKK
jgi:hypothetical protein